jgi:hypothetical protein
MIHERHEEERIAIGSLVNSLRHLGREATAGITAFQVLRHAVDAEIRDGDLGRVPARDQP